MGYNPAALFATVLCGVTLGYSYNLELRVLQMKLVPAESICSAGFRLHILLPSTFL